MVRPDIWQGSFSLLYLFSKACKWWINTLNLKLSDQQVNQIYFKHLIRTTNKNIWNKYGVKEENATIYKKCLK